MEPQLQLPWIFIVTSVRFARMDVTAFGDELKARVLPIGQSEHNPSDADIFDSPS
jgi:hypothetical protein